MVVWELDGRASEVIIDLQIIFINFNMNKN